MTAAEPFEDLPPGGYECTAYKSTKLTDIVCKRVVRLRDHRLVTIHPDFSNEKVWYLDRSCTLQPEYVEEIVAEKRTVRPPGTWTVTAKLTTVTGTAAQPIELYCVTINWPTSWLATRGYTSFTLGFETCQEAAQWHSHVQKQISYLRLRASSVKGGDSSTNHSSKPSYDDRSVPWSSGGALMRKPSQDKGFVAAALEHWLGSREDKAAAAEDAGGHAQSMQYRMPTSPVQIPIPSRPSSAPTTVVEDAAAQGELHFTDNRAYRQMACGDDDAADASSITSSCSQDDGPSQNIEEQRWVPYRHTNGVAIYHHKESKCAWVLPADGEEGVEELGSEYMASSIVRGSPDECLSVLMDLSSNTTILGPASRIELLEDGLERQVLRITVEATGMARRLCAPREVIVERLFKREECGVDVILFSSCDPPVVPFSPQARRRGATASTASLSGTAAGCSGTGPKHSQGFKAAIGAAAAAAAAGAAVCASSICFAAVAAVFVLLVVLLPLWCWHAAAARRGVRHGSAAAAAGSSRSWREWLSSVAAGGAVMWYKPVRAYVQGGYTISPREDSNGMDSPECLVTCILKVDLGGAVGERSWLRPFADALGWVDAYVERMLMAVILVKDEVEQRKFLVQPFSMLTSMAGATAAVPESPRDSTTDAAAPMDEVVMDGQHYKHSHMQRQRSSRRRQHQEQQLQQQQPFMAGMPEESGRQWQQQLSRRHSGMYAGVGGYAQPQFVMQGSQHSILQHVQQQQPHQISLGSSLDLQGSAGSASALSRKASQHKRQQGEKQKGRLGRMASRIYALRPRVLRGSTERAEPAPAAAASQLSTPLYKESISFNSHITARTNATASPSASDVDYSNAVAAAAGGRGAGADGTAAAATAAAIDLSDPKVLLASLGMPSDTVVVQPQYYLGGPDGPAARDSTLNKKFWSELHTPGTPAPFKLRGASYLEDRTKVDGGTPQFVLGSVDLVETPGPTQHISRFLPAVRCNQAAYSFVVNLIIPGTPVLSLVAVFINEHHPDILDPPSSSSSGGGSGSVGTAHSQLLPDDNASSSGASATGSAGMSRASGGDVRSSQSVLLPTGGCSTGNGAGADVDSSMESGAGDDADDGGSTSGGSVRYQRPADTADWQPFDYALHRFLHGDNATRTAMFKLIPHIAEGSWVIKQSVGTVPVILGNKLKTVYYQTDRYIEACCDVTSSSAAAYITGMVRGATKSLVIDLGFVLEGQHSEELPEALLGAFRLNHLDCTTAKKIDTSRELPLLPRPLQHPQLVALQQQAQQRLVDSGDSSEIAAAGGHGQVQPHAAVSADAFSRGSGAAAATAAAGGDSVAQQQQQQQQGTAGGPVLADKSEQQQQGQQAAMQMAQVQQLALQLQQRCRNSLSTIEGSRTMTGHARSRSAASVDELLTSSGSPRPDTARSCKDRTKPSHSITCSFSSPYAGTAGYPQQQQQHTGPGSILASPMSQQVSCKNTNPAAAGPGGVPSSSGGPPSIKTSLAGAAAAAGEGAVGGSVAGATPAKQLFSSFLSFSTGGSGERGSGSKHGVAASSADGSGVAATPAAAGMIAAGNGSLHACGAVSSLLTAQTPVATPLANTPHAAATTAGSLLATAGSVGSVGGRSNYGIATPTAAAPQSVPLRGHHRTSSTSDCRTPAGGSSAWPASPPMGPSPASAADLSSKLSAAAYISRAHAAALAASAQRRSHRNGNGSGTQQQAGSLPSSYAAIADTSGSSATAYLSVSPSNGGGGSGADGALDSEASGAGSWLSKRPRTSSSASGAITEHHQQQQGLGAGSAAGATVGPDILVLATGGSSGVWGSGGSAVGSGSGGQKISASEQLKLTQSTIKASSVSSSQATAHHAITSSSSGLGVLAALAAAAGGKQQGSAGEAGVGQAVPLATSSPPQQLQQVKRRFSHRRFASMGAVQ